MDTPPPNTRTERLAYAGFGLLLAASAYLAALPVDLELQYGLAWLLAGTLLTHRWWRFSGLPRLAFMAIAAFIALRYLCWRTLYTLHFHNPLDFAGALLLYLAELYGIAMFLLGLVVNLRPILREPAARPIKEEDHPSVDVYIPTFNEDIELLRITLNAATQLRYPESRLTVYVLDDGASEARLASSDRAIAVQAQRRREALRGLCMETGAHYLNRADNRHAKSGNLNAALRQTGGELILVLDADHVPTDDFLLKTVGHFTQDPRLFLVQTPHFFVTPDPIERNLNLTGRMPSENAMFFGAVHPGMDFWGASFFCGSAALLRRAALDEIGGFAEDSITEDAETALLLHSRGWRSVYLKQPLVSALQPDTFAHFISQRIRWAQGMVQILVKHNPLRLPGLRLGQRLCYLSCMLFWLFPFSRVVFLLAPPAYLVFDLNIYDAGLVEVFGYAVPYLVALNASASYMFGRFRWFMIADIYETMQSLFSLRAVFATLRNPRSPHFVVTPKLERLAEDFISPLASPFYLLAALLAASAVYGAYRLWMQPEERDFLLLAYAWLIVNLIAIMAALGALLERRQRRSNPRVPVNLDAYLQLGEQRIAIEVLDLSMGGAHAEIRGNTKFPDSLDSDANRLADAVLCIAGAANRGEIALPVRLVNRRHVSEKPFLGVRFTVETLDQFRRLVALVYGDSGRLAHQYQYERTANPGFLREIAVLVSVGLKHALLHFARLMGGLLARRPAVQLSLETRS